jgi:Ca-activated chloride channel homolog
MSFAWPIALSGLALVALALIAYLVAQRRRRRYVVRFTNLDLLENVVADSPRWRRHIPAVLTLLALSALVIGMARPQVAVAVPRQEATVILAMDSSGSMTATDVEPDRMTAAREAASSFVDGLPDGFRVGVVSFSN